MRWSLYKWARVWLLVSSVMAAMLMTECIRANQPSSGAFISEIAKIRSLSEEDSSKGFPVKVRAVVTAVSGWKNSFFIQVGKSGISVDRPDGVQVHPGDEVEVTGVTAPGLFAPVIAASEVVLVGQGRMPEAIQADAESLESGQLDSALVEVRGVIRSARVVESWGRKVLFLTLKLGNFPLTVRVYEYDEKELGGLVDARIAATGVCGTVFNDKRQLTGVQLFAPTLRNVRVVEAAPGDPFALAVTPLREIFRFGSAGSLDHRIKVAGIVTYQDSANNRLYVQSEGSGILLRTAEAPRVAPGSQIEAVGFVATGQYSFALDDAIFRKVKDGAAPEAIHAEAAQFIQKKDGFTFAPYDGLLVSTEAQLVEKVQHQDQEVWLMRSGDQIFQATLRSLSESTQLNRVRPGSRVRLTGIARTELNQRMEPKAFSILLRGAGDVMVVSSPLWNTRRSVLVSAALLIISGLMLAWAWQTGKVLREFSPAQSQLGEPSMAGKKAFANWAALAVGAIAALALLGWALDVGFLRTILPGLPAMYANIAVGLLLLGSALRRAAGWEEENRVVRDACAAVAGLIGLLTLIEYGFALNLHIDELLFRDVTSAAEIVHGRMAPASAICLILSAAALLLAKRNRFATASQLLGALTGLLCVLNLLGHLYGVRSLFAFGSPVGMAIHTAVSFLILSAGVLMLAVDRGVMSVFASNAPGGVVARTFLPAALILPALLGWLRMQGQFSYGLFGTAEGLALLTASTIVLFVVLTWANALLLNKLDAERERMRYAATHDALTKVLNRNGAMALLDSEMARATREKKAISVVLLDVDHFKAINDQLGHQAGDEVLRELPRRLKAELRSYDAIGRYGGEEFMVVLPGCDLRSAMGRADKLRMVIAGKAVALNSGLRAVTVSMGVAVLEPEMTTSRDELLREADIALYAAKRSGRNCVRAFADVGKQEALIS